MIRVLYIFIVLQLIDLGTTLGVLALGGYEQNPLVVHFMSMGPWQGLIFAKVIALGIGAGCFLSRRYRALRLANLAFTGIAIWNTGILLLLMA